MGYGDTDVINKNKSKDMTETTGNLSCYAFFIHWKEVSAMLGYDSISIPQGDDWWSCADCSYKFECSERPDC